MIAVLENKVSVFSMFSEESIVYEYAQLKSIFTRLFFVKINERQPFQLARPAVFPLNAKSHHCGSMGFQRNLSTFPLQVTKQYSACCFNYFPP
jgi:hypothetical protein